MLAFTAQWKRHIGFSEKGGFAQFSYLLVGLTWPGGLGSVGIAPALTWTGGRGSAGIEAAFNHGGLCAEDRVIGFSFFLGCFLCWSLAQGWGVVIPWLEI